MIGWLLVTSVEAHPAKIATANRQPRIVSMRPRNSCARRRFSLLLIDASSSVYLISDLHRDGRSVQPAAGQWTIKRSTMSPDREPSPLGNRAGKADRKIGDRKIEDRKMKWHPIFLSSIFLYAFVARLRLDRKSTRL